MEDNINPLQKYIQDVQQVLSINNYLMTAKIDSVSQQCSITYPVIYNITLPIDTLIIRDGKLIINGQKPLTLPKYCIRPYILVYIYKQCLKMHYPPQFISFLSDDDAVLHEHEFIQKFPLHITPLNQQLENKLLSCLLQGFLDNKESLEIQNVLQQNKIMRGYNLVMKMFNS